MGTLVCPRGGETSRAEVKTACPPLNGHIYLEIYRPFVKIYRPFGLFTIEKISFSVYP
jgi:hypothetical protein